MVDIYSAIVGEPPTEQEKLQALAAKLRGRSQLGQLGMLTGDKVLAPMGQGIGEQTEAQVAKIGGFQARRRELDAQRNMAEMEDKAALERLAVGHGYDMKELRARQAFDAQQNALQRGLSRSLAELKGEPDKKYQKLTAKDVERLTATNEDVINLEATAQSFKPEYAGTGVPGVRALKNTIAAKGLGTKEMMDAQKWWADWDKLYTLPTRNKMFGSALTAPEQKAWKEANITQDMTAEQIQANIKLISDLRAKAAVKMGKNFEAANYDPEAIQEIFGGSSVEDNVAAASGGGGPKFYVGQIVKQGDKTYRVTGGDLNGDPDVEEVK